jgi:hypothetical protein
VQTAARVLTVLSLLPSVRTSTQLSLLVTGVKWQVNPLPVIEVGSESCSHARHRRPDRWLGTIIKLQ